MAHRNTHATDDGSPSEAFAAIARMKQTYESASELVDEILDMFVADAPERIAALQQAVGAADYETARRAAHSLANTTGALRCERALKAARDTETAARGEDCDALTRAAAALTTAVEEILSAIETHRSGPAASGL